MARARVTGDYLQTAAIFDEEMNVLSALEDPNDYRGPGTGYRPTAERQAQIDAVRQARSVTDLVREQATFAQPDRLAVRGPARVGEDPREVVIGVSPAFGTKLFRTLSGMTIYDALEQILAGPGGGTVRGAAGSDRRQHRPRRRSGSRRRSCPAPGSGSDCRPRAPRSSTAATCRRWRTSNCSAWHR